MEISLTSYFYFKLNSLDSFIQSESIGSLLSRVKNCISMAIFHQPFKPKSFSKLINRLQNRSNIEEKILKKRLKAALQSKHQLQDQLLLISNSISTLQKSKKNLQSSKHSMPHSVSHSIDHKRFFDLHKKTENFLKQQTEKVKRNAKALEESDLIKAIKMKEIRKMFRESELEKLRQRKENREKLMKILNINKTKQENAIKKKPLFLKLEENFKFKVEMPELEKRKAELKKKKEGFAPIGKLGLKEHAEWYESMKKKKDLTRILEQPKPGRSASVNNMWSLNILEEDKRIEEEKNKKIEEKRNLMSKMLKYSDLIKELHAPSTPEKIKNKKRRSKIGKESSGKIFKILESGGDSESISSSLWKPHKFAKNPMIPPPKPIRTPNTLFYLEEKRQLYKPITSPPSSTALEQHTSFQSLQNDTKKLEKIALKEEIFSNTKPFSIHSIYKSLSANDLLLKSINAKIKFLKKN